MYPEALCSLITKLFKGGLNSQAMSTCGAECKMNLSRVAKSKNVIILNFTRSYFDNGAFEQSNSGGNVTVSFLLNGYIWSGCNNERDQEWLDT